MPVPYVDVGSDIMKSWMAGRQLAMAQFQMQMESQRIQEERRQHDLQNQHNLASLAEEAKWHANNYKLMSDQAKRATEKQDFEAEQGLRGDVQKGLYGTAPGQPGIDTSSASATGATLANAPTSLGSTINPSQIPTNLLSPADQTQQVVNQDPNSPQAIQGMVGPQIAPQPIQGPSPVVQQVAAPSISAMGGRVTLSPEQQQAIPVKPPMSEAEKLAAQSEYALKLEGKRQEQEQRQLEATKVYHTQEIAVQNRAADLALENLKQTMGLRRDVFGVKIADDAGKIAEKVIAGPVFQKQLNNYGPLMDYMKDLTAKDANGRAGNTSGIADAEAMNRLNVMVAGTPLASMARVKDFADSLKTTPENLGNKIRQLTNKNDVLLSPDQKKQLGLAIHQALINVHQDYVMRFNAGAQQMKQIHFGEDPATITKYSGILGDFKDEK